MSGLHRFLSSGVVVLVVVGDATPAPAQAPPFVPLHGRLSRADGTVVDGVLNVTFALYADGGGAAELWRETQAVLFDEGVFAVDLGAQTPLDLTLFRDHGAVFVGITVEGDVEMPLFALSSAPFAAYAEHAGTTPPHRHVFADLDEIPLVVMTDRDTLGGMSCADGSIAQVQGGVWTCGSIGPGSDSVTRDMIRGGERLVFFVENPYCVNTLTLTLDETCPTAVCSVSDGTASYYGCDGSCWYGEPERCPNSRAGYLVAE